MTHIRIRVRGDGCEIPDGKRFLIVVSEDIENPNLPKTKSLEGKYYGNRRSIYFYKLLHRNTLHLTNAGKCVYSCAMIRKAHCQSWHGRNSRVAVRSTPR